MEKILVVVDMQNDFVDGSLGTVEAEQIVAGVCQRITKAHAQGERIFLTMDTHSTQYLSTQEGIHLPVPHCIYKTPGWMLNPQVEAAAGPSARRFEKNTFGVMDLARTLAALCQDKGLEEGRGMEVELCGVCTDICVVTNALLIKTALPEAHLLVNPRLCAGVTPEKHAAALDVLASCQVEILDK